MKKLSVSDAVYSLSISVLLLLVAWQTPAIKDSANERIARVVTRMFDRHMSWEDRDRKSWGYYDALLNDGSRVGRTGQALFQRLVGDWTAESPALYRSREDFLLFDFAPNLRVDFTDLRTNHFGMADREYSQAKPAGTRRIVVLGDSMARGFGAAHDSGWEPRLERWMNDVVAAEHPSVPSAKSIEILNFAVDGFSITQCIDMVRERTTQFEPDVYMLVLSDRMLSDGDWAAHIARVMQSGRNLKYPYLQETLAPLVSYSGAGRAYYLKRIGSKKVMTLEWAFRELKYLTAINNAQVMAVLMPSLPTHETPAGDPFHDIRPILDSAKIRTVDLSDTFTDVPNLEAVRFDNPYNDDDRHPNAMGYALLLDRLRQQTIADRSVWELLFGAN